MDFEDKTVLVAGLGLSGEGAVSLLRSLNTKIVLYDGNMEIDKKELIRRLELSEETRIYLGEFPYELLKEVSYIVLSPGISVEMPYIIEAQKQGIQVIGEIELAYGFCKGNMIAITGTNGKTTTTALTGSILNHYFKSVFVVGNIGTSFAGAVLETNEDSVTAAEISSFQLETVKSFRPHISAVLNVTPDHLNRHHTMENYLEVKMNIARNQKKDDICVLNYEDEMLKNYASKLIPRVMFFSSRNKIEDGVYLEKDKIYLNQNAQDIEVCHINKLKLIGIHNYENVMVAIAVTISAGVPLEVVREAVINFAAVEHRIEYVTKKNGVVYYNDSKGTNPDASIKAVEAMTYPTILIAGGYDKGADYSGWIKTFSDKIKSLVLIGETKYAIADAAKTQGYTNILFAETLEEAVKTASQEAEQGDAVLLSPACASWGMFKDYEQRGRLFKEYVNRI